MSAVTLYPGDPLRITLLRVADAMNWATARPIRIAVTDTRSLHIVTQLVQLCGLSCDTDLADGWVTVTIVGGES